MPAYYNDLDPCACHVLEALIAEGHIAPGVVECRSITEIQSDELARYTQVHLFAGFGGWSLALRSAGWPDDWPVWTGSCPCQPFSSAGAGRGLADERHLWPEMFRLVRECGPSAVIGEQVASAAGLGWLDGVFADLEGAGYACGAADLCAASIGAPHIRQRLFWVADAIHDRQRSDCGAVRDQRHDAGRGGENGERLADAQGRGLGGWGRTAGSDGPQAVHGGERDDRGLADAGGGGRDGRAPEPERGPAPRDAAAGAGEVRRGLANTNSRGRSQAGLCVPEGDSEASDRPEAAWSGGSGSNGFWSNAELVRCVEPTKDGGTRQVWRRAEPGVFPLDDGSPGRRQALRLAGNGIVVPLAAAFVEAVMEVAE